MSTQFTSTVAAARAVPPDPSKHVNYTLGMLLGVDDFNQEFAYLDGRDRWLARDAIGYGTLNGLRVSRENTAGGPRIVISAGSALSPSGRLICVKQAQCATLNDWLAAKRSEVAAKLPSTPGSVQAWLTLRYRCCPVDDLPIPGEPCRSDDELMSPSRLVDDFTLEITLNPVYHTEEHGVREFVAWMKQIQITDEPGTFTSIGSFEAALRAGIPTPEYVAKHGLQLPFGSPLTGIRIHPLDVRNFFAVAWRIWVTEIRPLVHSVCVSPAPCDCGADPSAAPDLGDSVLLAALSIPVVAGPGSSLVVDDTKNVWIDESYRPFLIHLRMLQEWLRAGQEPESDVVVQGPAAAKSVQIVAAGIVGAGTLSQPPVLGGLTLEVPGPGRLTLKFPSYRQPNGHFNYILKVMPMGATSVPSIGVDTFNTDANGISLRATVGSTLVTQTNLQNMRFLVEVTRIE